MNRCAYDMEKKNQKKIICALWTNLMDQVKLISCNLINFQI